MNLKNSWSEGAPDRLSRSPAFSADTMPALLRPLGLAVASAATPFNALEEVSPTSVQLNCTNLQQQATCFADNIRCRRAGAAHCLGAYILLMTRRPSAEGDNREETY